MRGPSRGLRGVKTPSLKSGKGREALLEGWEETGGPPGRREGSGGPPGGQEGVVRPSWWAGRGCEALLEVWETLPKV